jgi:hypothetical protein
VHRRYEASLDDYEAGIDALVRLFDELDERYIATLLAMRDTLADTEWQAIMAEIRAQQAKYAKRYAKAAERKTKHE